MIMRSRSMRCLMTTFILLGLLLSACDQPSSTSSSSTTGSPSSGTVAATKTRAIVGVQQNIDLLDPHLATSTGTQEIMFNVFTALVNTDSEGRVIPEMALDWEISEDQLTYDFILRPGMQFHNGQKVRPADVKYTIERLQGKTADQMEALSSSFNAIREITISDAPEGGTVQFKLNQPDASLLGKLIVAAIIPENSGPEQAKNPIGAGPFRFVSYAPGVNIKMEKFAEFYQPDLPKLDEVEFRVFSDSNAAFLALQKGELDIYNVSLDQRNALDKDKFEVISTPQNMIQLVGLNMEYEPFKDLRVRQALNYAIDKDEIIEMLAPGSQKLGTNFCAVMAFYAEKDLEKIYPFDPEKAKALLAKAGYSDLKFTLRLPSDYPFHIDTAQIIQSQLKKVGVTMELDTIEFNSWVEQVYNGFQHQATLVGLTGKLDPDAVVGRFASTHRNNFMRYNNPEVDRLLLAGKATANQDQRAAIYKEIQTIIAQEVPGVFIMDITLYRAVNKRLTTLPTYPIGYIDMKAVEVR